METIELVDAQTIAMTPAAIEKVQALLAERSLPDHGLRVFVAGGGCSGMQYGMALEAKPRDFDHVVDAGGVKLFVDPTSMMYLAGANIDYVDNLMGGGFRIDNPNAVSTCGCGHSFRTSDSNSASDEGAGCGCH
jgi:iron-sulfur cluster assembly protein